MAPVETNETEKLVQLSRRQLWLTLALALLTAAIAAIRILAPVRLDRAGIPLAIIAFVVVALPTVRGISLSRSNRAMRALENDELRQAAQAKAYRNGFFALLGVQAVLPLLLTWLSAPYGVAFMAGISSLTGAVVFLASFLYYDR